MLLFHNVSHLFHMEKENEWGLCALVSILIDRSPVISTRTASSLWHLTAEDWQLPRILNQNQLAIASESGETIGVFIPQWQGINE